MSIGPQREVGEFGGLAGARLGDFASTVPDLADEQAGQPVKVALAVLVVYVLTLAADDYRDVGIRVPRMAGEVQPQVALRCLLQCGLAGLGVHLVPQLYVCLRSFRYTNVSVIVTPGSDRTLPSISSSWSSSSHTTSIRRSNEPAVMTT